MLWVKSPCRTRSVPANSSWTDPVIDRASARPIDERHDLDDEEQQADDQQQHEQQPLAETAAVDRPCAAEIRVVDLADAQLHRRQQRARSRRSSSRDARES